MATPTIQDLFGTTATVTNNTLSIKFADFTDVGWTDAAGTTSAEKWLTAILLKARAFTAAQIDEMADIEVNAPFLGLVQRNSVNKRQYSYSVNVYETDSGAAAPDPDNV